MRRAGPGSNKLRYWGGYPAGPPHWGACGCPDLPRKVQGGHCPSELPRGKLFPRPPPLPRRLVFRGLPRTWGVIAPQTPGPPALQVLAFEGPFSQIGAEVVSEVPMAISESTRTNLSNGGIESSWVNL